jgi:hypothetical protein
MKIRQAMRLQMIGGADILPCLKVLWSTAPCLYKAAIRPTAVIPVELAALRWFTREGEAPENFLAELLEDSSPMLVAYGLLGLQMMRSERLRHLPDSVKKSQAVIQVRVGSFCSQRPLAQIAYDS